MLVATVATSRGVYLSVLKMASPRTMLSPLDSGLMYNLTPSFSWEKSQPSKVLESSLRYSRALREVAAWRLLDSMTTIAMKKETSERDNEQLSPHGSSAVLYSLHAAMTSDGCVTICTTACERFHSCEKQSALLFWKKWRMIFLLWCWITFYPASTAITDDALSMIKQLPWLIKWLDYGSFIKKYPIRVTISKWSS